MFKIELGMKKHIHLTGIWLLVALLALMVACDPKEKVVEPMEKPLPELATIDSLMWRQPDSAFAVLRQFVASHVSFGILNKGYEMKCLVITDTEGTGRKDLHQSSTFRKVDEAHPARSLRRWSE